MRPGLTNDRICFQWPSLRCASSTDCSKSRSAAAASGSGAPKRALAARSRVRRLRKRGPRCRHSDPMLSLLPW